MPWKSEMKVGCVFTAELCGLAGLTKTAEVPWRVFESLFFFRSLSMYHHFSVSRSVLPKTVVLSNYWEGIKNRCRTATLTSDLRKDKAASSSGL